MGEMPGAEFTYSIPFPQDGIDSFIDGDLIIQAYAERPSVFECFAGEWYLVQSTQHRNSAIIGYSIAPDAKYVNVTIRDEAMTTSSETKTTYIRNPFAGGG